jgi:hypothetical protein
MKLYCCDILSTSLIPIICIGMYAVLISLLQEKLIYMPRSYSGRHSKYYKQRRMKTNQKLMSIGSRKIINLKYTIANGMSQTAYFLPPPTSMKTNNEMEEDTTPFHLWMTSSGNAGLAYDWFDFSTEFMKLNNDRISADVHHGFLLIDYPGYGRNKGDPSPSSILESSQNALHALHEHLNSNSYHHLRRNYSKISYVAHSIGCSAVLQHAVSIIKESENQINRIVLVSPFTTMIDMAKIALPMPIPGISYLLRHQWNNIKSLEDMGKYILLNRKGNDIQKLEVTIIHGNMDEIVPVEMGRTLREVAVSWMGCF